MRAAKITATTAAVVAVAEVVVVADAVGCGFRLVPVAAVAVAFHEGDDEQETLFLCLFSLERQDGYHGCCCQQQQQLETGRVMTGYRPLGYVLMEVWSFLAEQVAAAVLAREHEVDSDAGPQLRQEGYLWWPQESELMDERQLGTWLDH